MGFFAGLSDLIVSAFSHHQGTSSGGQIVPVVKVRGIENVLSMVMRVETSISSGAIYDDVKERLLKETQARFLKQQAPDGSTWPVSQAALRRQRRGKQGGTLYDTGALFKSLEAITAPDGIRLQVNPSAVNPRTHMRVSTYARKHQLGLDGMPVRKFIGVGPRDEEMIVNLVTKRLREIINAR